MLTVSQKKKEELNEEKGEQASIGGGRILAMFDWIRFPDRYIWGK